MGPDPMGGRAEFVEFAGFYEEERAGGAARGLERNPWVVNPKVDSSVRGDVRVACLLARNPDLHWVGKNPQHLQDGPCRGW